MFWIGSARIGRSGPVRSFLSTREEDIMKTLTRWNPFREVAPFAAFPDMDPFFAEWPFRTMIERYQAVPMMRVDVVEDAKGYMLTAELPGMNKEDIAVSIDGNNVSINAEAKHEKEVKGEGKEEGK